VFVVDEFNETRLAAKDTVYNFRQTQVVNRLSDFAKKAGVHVNSGRSFQQDGFGSEPPKKSIRRVSTKEIDNLL